MLRIKKRWGLHCTFNSRPVELFYNSLHFFSSLYSPQRVTTAVTETREASFAVCPLHERKMSHFFQLFLAVAVLSYQ